MSGDYCSRFIAENDDYQKDFIFTLPDSWWSRQYEYAWASGFADPGDRALDAASGIEHPLKFYLLDRCRECYACDVDERIVSREAIKAALAEKIGEEAASSFPDRYFDKINYARASLEQLPYPDKFFDKIYCISVLEHLPDVFKKRPWTWPFRRFLPFVDRLVEASLAEFRRVLKDDGLIVLTFDYPRINLEYLKMLLPELGLEFHGPVDYLLPGNAVHSVVHRLHCFRTVLRKCG